MANPTTNFGWQMPTPTDLVTSLPADFEVFGQAVDTDFVDLLGGTTGQILSKTSNTDLDFTWIAQPAGDITGITTAAGSGLAGGTTSGNATLTLSSTYTTKTDDYTFAAGDEYNIFSMNSGVVKQFLIPTDATYNFAIGTEIIVFWITGAGQPSIAAVTPGTTSLISTGGTSSTPKLRVANSGATIKKLAANSWICFGDVALHQ
jgi:hypothetical protein